MGKKTKNEELDFLYVERSSLEKEEKKTSKVTTKKKDSNKLKPKTTKKVSSKKEDFDFEDEIIIGVKKTPTKVTSKKKEPAKKRGRVKPKETKKNKNTKIERKQLEEISVNTKIKAEETKKGADKKSAQTKRRKVNQKQLPKETKSSTWTTNLIKWTVLIIALIASFIFFMMSPLFNVVEVNVIHNQKITSDTILSLSEIQLGENIYKTSSNKIEKNIKQNAYIESVTVSRKLPNKIELLIKERETTYMLEYANSYAYINNQGYILEITQQKAEVPILVGFTTTEEEIKVGGRIKEGDLEQLAVVLKIMESANGNSIEPLITKIDVAHKQNYMLLLEEKKKTVYLGDASNLSNRMLYIKAMIEKEEGIEGEIHVEGDINKGNAFFREKE